MLKASALPNTLELAGRPCPTPNGRGPPGRRPGDLLLSRGDRQPRVAMASLKIFDARMTADALAASGR
jgi:hypothetical protein